MEIYKIAPISGDSIEIIQEGRLLPEIPVIYVYFILSE